MSAFHSRRLRLDRKVFARLSDGEAVIDGIPMAVMYDKASFQFADSRGTERIISLSQALADEKGLKPHTNTIVEWQGKRQSLAHPPMYEDGLIKLVLR